MKYADGGNLFEYVDGNSNGSTDPSGLKVYWCVRDIDGFFVGNHGYFVLVPDNPGDFKNLIDLYGGNQGFTIGGHKVSGCLVAKYNQKADVAACREYHDDDRYDGRGNKDRYKGGWSLECHLVNPPAGMTDTEFIKLLIQYTNNFQKNSKIKECPYTLLNFNCHAFVNQMLCKAGVPKKERCKAGEFKGVDWGEEDKCVGEWRFDKPVRK